MHFVRPIRRSRSRPRRLLAEAIAALAVVGAAFALLAWHAARDAAKPPRAGEPIDPYVTAAHIVVARAEALVGDTRDAGQHIEAVTGSFTRSARIPDAMRPIDHEAARAAVRPITGVRSAIWLDRENLAVMVGGARYRSMSMIDDVCRALDPLGDTLAVVVHVQDATATTADGAMTLSRNCQLSAGQRALFQARRKVDVVSPELRATFKAQQRPAARP
ncbi:MAG TPA: hypothetical protein VHE32_04470 [Rhodanobacteraceae bacterium]|jgi:hypothetical protein|nr:hypothetical protein [Rhodanobacteraceae bacterium]